MDYEFTEVKKSQMFVKTKWKVCFEDFRNSGEKSVIFNCKSEKEAYSGLACANRYKNTHNLAWICGKLRGSGHRFFITREASFNG